MVSCMLIDLLTELGQFARINNAGDIEVWRTLHTLGEPSSDGAAHRGQRNFDHIFCASGSHRLRFSVSCGDWRYARSRDCLLLSGDRGLDIQLNDASIGTAASQLAIVYLIFLSQ